MRLQRYTEDDVDFILECTHSFETVGSYLSLEKLTRNQYLARLEKGYYWNDKAQSYTIRLLDEFKEDSRIGLIRYWTDATDNRTALLTVQIAYPVLRGQGLGTEAQKALIRKIFKDDQFKSVAMHTDLDNIAQQKCLKKLGFSEIHDLTYNDFGIQRNGTLYSLSKEIFQAIKDYIYVY